MYACMYVCMYVCMHVCMYACMYVCMYVCMHVCMHACMYVCMYICVYICIYIYIYFFFNTSDQRKLQVYISHISLWSGMTTGIYHNISYLKLDRMFISCILIYLNTKLIMTSCYDFL